jgi:DNA-binding MarR family transcriptional regulator
VTSVVDRLEERALVSRRAHPEDRRVKVLVLTDAGRATRAAIDERMFATMTVFDGLTDDERRQLVVLLAKIGAAPDPDPDRSPTPVAS